MTIFAPINDGLNGWSRTGLSAMIDNYRQFPTEGRRMTTMISEVYSAFKTAGVPEQEAKQAAEALSAENLATKDTVVEVKQELTSQIGELKRMMSVMQSMLGLVLLAVVLPILRDAVN